jgi:lysylphosphatidylglycerol synthetase-like protein (DUF2156 family)
VLALLRRHGAHVTSFQVLEPGFSYWFDGEACVAYVEAAGAWVAAGAPLAPAERVAEVMGRFAQAAQAAGRRARFFAIEPSVVPEGFEVIPIGARPEWDPCAWEEGLKRHRSLREQIRRSRAKGVKVRRVAPAELVEGAPLRAAVDALIARWVASKPMPAMGFLVDVHPYGFPEARRYFVAEQGERLVGFLAAVPIFQREGWLFEDLLRDPTSPNGTPELLVDVAMRALAEEGSRLVTLGLVPLADVPKGWLRWIRDHSRWLYDFEGLRRFKAKLAPRDWSPVGLAFPRGQTQVLAVTDALQAFARGSFFRFGLRTAVHAAPLTARILATLLVPWTVALALAPTARWFPSRAVQWGWVGFDVGMAAGLYWLSARWRKGLATTLATLATADATLTLYQAVAYNGARARGALDWAVIGAAVAAPIAASVFLWRSRGRDT